MPGQTSTIQGTNQRYRLTTVIGPNPNRSYSTLHPPCHRRSKRKNPRLDYKALAEGRGKRPKCQ